MTARNIDQTSTKWARTDSVKDLSSALNSIASQNPLNVTRSPSDAGYRRDLMIPRTSILSDSDNSATVIKQPSLLHVKPQTHRPRRATFVNFKETLDEGKNTKVEEVVVSNVVEKRKNELL